MKIQNQQLSSQMKILRYIAKKYSDTKDIVLLWRINRMLKSAKKEEVKMIDKVLKLWQ